MSYITIVPVERPQAGLILPLGLETPRFSAGIAKWNEVDRPRRRNMLEFVSEGLGKLSFDVLLNRWPDGDVEDLIGTIFAWGARMDLPQQPPVLQIDGPVPYSNLNYVLTKCDDSGVCYRNEATGARCVQQLKLELTEYQAPDLIAVPLPPAQAARARALIPTETPVNVAAPRTYTVKPGDTLVTIAARQLGDYRKWSYLASINTLRDPKHLFVGQVIRLS